MSTAEGMQGVLDRTGFCAAFEFVAERFGRGVWAEVPVINVFTPLPAIASCGGLAGGGLHNSVTNPLLDGKWAADEAEMEHELKKELRAGEFLGQGNWR